MTITLSDIQTACRNKEFAFAEQAIIHFIHELFNLSVKTVTIRQDSLSLNSVNGILYLKEADPKSGATSLFFKFHHEEKEMELKEYYNGQLLADNGFPIDMPLYASHEVGKQVVIYPVKTSQRLFDVCKPLDVLELETTEKKFFDVQLAQIELDKICGKKYEQSLHAAPLEKLYDEPILQLFVRRLTDDIVTKKDSLGGRYELFYANKPCAFPGDTTLDFEELKKLTWVINGLEYDITLEKAFENALHLMSPEAHMFPKNSGTYPAVIAHGDAHNGNVWYNTKVEDNKEKAFLSFFDPAFAGKHIPALLAEIKPTFHNIFAHPLWLYDSVEADKNLNITCKIEKNAIHVTHNWKLPALREEFLITKRDYIWKPLLKKLREQSMLQDNWEEYIRTALFCCPALVMNLRANAGNATNFHTPQTSLLGFALSVMLISPPKQGKDIISTFFATLS